MNHEQDHVHSKIRSQFDSMPSFESSCSCISALVLLLVVLFLNGAHLYPEDLLHLGRQRFFHIFLHSAQQEGLQLFVKAGIARVSALPMLLFKHLPRVKSTNIQAYISDI